MEVQEAAASHQRARDTVAAIDPATVPDLAI
jgi:hypothetical protein